MNGLVLNRDIFWELYRKNFKEPLYQPTVDGLNYILGRFENETRLDNIPQFSYALATAYHESGHKNSAGQFIRFQPVREKKAASNSEVWIKYQSKYWHTGYYGRGIIQITFVENYLKIGQLTGAGDAFVKNPDLLLELKWSYESLVAGMSVGIYRRDQKGKHTLDRHLPGETATLRHYFNAREIVNGDSFRKRPGAVENIGTEIADSAVRFDRILRAALIRKTENFDNLSADKIILEIPAAEEPSPVQFPSVLPAADDFVSDNEITGNTNIGNSANFPPIEGFQPPDKPSGDAPDQEPRAWLHVEDWKPFCFRWLKRIWSVFSGANFTQALALGWQGLSDPANFWIYAGAIIFIFFVLFILAVVISVVLLIIWYVNRKEISKYIEISKQSLIDPKTYNLGLSFEKK